MRARSHRIVGIDIGTETVKLVELVREGGRPLSWARRQIAEHGKEPGRVVLELLRAWRWDGVAAAAVSGRLGRQLALQRIPTQQAQVAGFRFLRGDREATVVSIGGHGFSVLELRPSGLEVFRENSRCSQGTGNFLRQLVERFDLTVEQASELCADVQDAAPLSGRCPVILKTDMTHLANKGEERARILAGLYDAVCENVQVLIKPRICPERVSLIGGVARSRRIHENFGRFLERHGMQLVSLDGDDGLYVEALGCAVIAAEREGRPPAIDALLARPPKAQLEELPALSSYLGQVERMTAPPPAPTSAKPVILGFDIGSTGSKVVALCRETSEVVWEGYLKTNGTPVGAAQALMKRFVDGPAGGLRVVALGVTGSGREIVGSLMATCYGSDSVFVLNEIAAHARGALHFDPRVDTIFEIGGQDAKYIRLAGGRVVDAAMNEACSAGTGSFIEEQGSKFSGVGDVSQLGGAALESSSGVSLGQHCSVFMAEIVDQAVGAGVGQGAIIAGIYDSIIQNYLNRVKGSRTVGQVVFCQGMPFSADALGAAVARQTGGRVVIPPNPGTVGALGIALLTKDELGGSEECVDPAAFLGAQVEKKDTFVCKATRGCGGAGNRCRIDGITTRVNERRKRYLWGGGCSLWDKGTRKKKLPDLSPDPFREREDLVQRLLESLPIAPGAPSVALTDEFLLKGLFPFFASFLAELGFRPTVSTGADHATLKRGIEEANVPFCAPMQLYHGLVGAMADQRPDFLLLPMVRSLPRVADETASSVCPIVQGSPDMLRMDLGKREGTTIVSTVIDVGERNLRSEELRSSCRRLARDLGAPDELFAAAVEKAIDEQSRFEARCLDLGRRALEFSAVHGIVPVVVLGRPYTIYNKVLNSNVPAILREQGAIAIPVDCYPVDGDVPAFDDVYWGHGQRNLRAAHQIRRTPGIYSVYCSNYSCGPDSFTLHFYGYLMEGKPFAVLETDGHSGDAGTKTRVEAFLHCVRSDLAGGAVAKAENDLLAVGRRKDTLDEIRKRGARVIIPRMGPGAEALAACLQGLGVRAETLPMPTTDTVRLGRRYTSGKECVPMTITLGSLLERIERERGGDDQFVFFMPTARGPCRFGVYNLLHKIILERLGWKDRVGVWSPDDGGYFTGVPQGFAVLVFTGFMASDLLLESLFDARPVEREPGAALEIYERWHAELLRQLRLEGAGDVSVPGALMQVASGRLFGCWDLCRRAAAELARIKEPRAVPTVLLVGEVYARCDPFTNDFIVDKLEQRGIRVRFAPFNEWLEYTDYLNLEAMGAQAPFGSQMSSWVQTLIQNVMWAAAGSRLGWSQRTSVQHSLAASSSYLRSDLHGEAVLTLGGPIHEWRERQIDAVVSVGPLECMPNKIAEAQFFHVAEREGLLNLTIPLNGDPIDPEVVDSFAFEVHERFRKKKPSTAHRPTRFLPALGRDTLVQIRRSATSSFRMLAQTPAPWGDLIPLARRQ
ncbi:MAG: CoA activase [Deltaproteobacteria bacterium]|nr:CoA activase [Deltaproteobacteria bacterium]